MDGGSLAHEVARLATESRELDLLIESTRTEIARHKAREEQARAKLDQARTATSVADVATAADEHAAALGRRMTMEGELGALEAKRRLMDRTQGLLTQAGHTPPPAQAAPLVSARETDSMDETRLLQAIVETQEEERKRIARRVHDGPAQAMANVVLQSEISERLYAVDQERSRAELASLRQMVNKTLQELRAFIFELRPMILDDLGLVPTLRRYVQTLIDKHGIRIDFASTGRDRRLASDDEVAIFRLIQDALVERIEKGSAKDIAIAMTWKDESLEIIAQSDGRELPPDADTGGGLRRSERLRLLRGTSTQETKADGSTVIAFALPIKAPPQLIS